MYSLSNLKRMVYMFLWLSKLILGKLIVVSLVKWAFKFGVIGLLVSESLIKITDCLQWKLKSLSYENYGMLMSVWCWPYCHSHMGFCTLKWISSSQLEITTYILNYCKRKPSQIKSEVGLYQIFIFALMVKKIFILIITLLEMRYVQYFPYCLDCL